VAKVHCVHDVLRCGYKSTVKLLFIPVDRGVGIETSAHTTVVVVVDVVVVDVVVVDVVVVDVVVVDVVVVDVVVVDVDVDVGDVVVGEVVVGEVVVVDVIVGGQVDDEGMVESTADARVLLNDTTDNSAITVNTEPICGFFMNMTIATFIKQDVRNDSTEI